MAFFARHGGRDAPLRRELSRVREVVHQHLPEEEEEEDQHRPSDPGESHPAEHL